MSERQRDDRTSTPGDVPRTAREQDAPEPERPLTPAEEAGTSPHQVDEPPQAEGDRDDDDR